MCLQTTVEAELFLSTMPAVLRLDLHNTLDTVDPDVNIFPSSCCISFVGRLSQRRLQARLDIQERIDTGQIKYGVLVFMRGKRDQVFLEDGSKAWFNRVVPTEEGLAPLFIDDSLDHIMSVQHVGVRSVRILPTDALVDLISLEELDQGAIAQVKK